MAKIKSHPMTLLDMCTHLERCTKAYNLKSFAISKIYNTYLGNYIQLITTSAFAVNLSLDADGDGL